MAVLTNTVYGLTFRVVPMLNQTRCCLLMGTLHAKVFCEQMSKPKGVAHK